MPTMKPNRSRVLVLTSFSILLASFLLASLYSVVASADDPPERHILVLIDESGSTRGTPELDPMDPDGRRIRFAEFLVRYLQTFFPQEALVGVTGFVSDTLQIVPMTTQAESWKQADFAAIRPTLDDFYATQVDENKEPLRTRFYTVLQDASEGFDDLNCTDRGTQCGIVLFSDGLWGVESIEQLQGQLTALDDRGIQLVVALFGGDLADDKRSITPSIREAGGWAHVRDVWTLPDVANNAVISNSTTLPPHEVYEQIVEALKIAEPLRDLSRVDVTDTGIISATIPPYTRFAQVRLLPDSPMQETWSLAPDVVAGTQRWWLDPPAGALQGQLSRAADLADTGIVYFTVDHTQYPIQFDAQVLPEKLLVGAPVQLAARFSVNGRAITNTTDLGVDVLFEPGSASLSLQPSASGLFTATWVAPANQVYTATFTPNLGTGQDLPSGIAPIARRFLVAAAPEIALAVGKPVSQTTFYIVPVTVTVKNADSLLASEQPRLELISEGLSQTMPLAVATTLPDQTKEYTSQVQLLPNSDLRLRASLPAGRTRDGIEYGAQSTGGTVRLGQETKSLSILQELSGSPWVLAAIALIVMFALYFFFAYLVQRRRQRIVQKQRRYVRDIQDRIGRSEKAEELLDLLKKPPPDNPEWLAFCYEFAEEILRDRDLSSTS